MSVHTKHLRIFILIATIASIAFSVATVVLWLLYSRSLDEQSERLQQVANLQSSLIKTTLYFAKQAPQLMEHPIVNAVKVMQETEANNIGFGLTGDITLASYKNGEIVYYYSQREAKTDNDPIIRFRSNLSEPMTKALAGERGLVIGKDFRGVKVLAAYQPISELGLGLVSKIDIAEINKPFVNAGWFSAMAGVILVILGSFIYLRINEKITRQEDLLHSRYRSILDNALDGIININKYGSIQSINKAALSMFGYEAHEVLGRNVNVLMATSLRDVHDSYIQTVSNNRKAKTRALGTVREVDGLRKDGSVFPIEIALSRIVVDDDMYFTGIVRDLTERKRAARAMEEYREHLEDQVAKRTQELTLANKKLEKLANLDGLTGIANRRVFDDDLKKEWRRAKRQNTVLSLLMCDVDYFKNYNDSYGHLAGDECLRKIAATMQNLFQRAGDLVSRYGGEEFAIILPGVPYRGVTKVVEQLRLSIAQLGIKHLRPDGSSIVTISVGGVTVLPELEMSEQDIVSRADKALYQAKQKGRNICVTEEIKS